MAARRRKRRYEEHVPMPALTSLMDILTVILIFLIKTFSTSAIEVQNPSVQLPISSSQENIENLVVVMITGIERREIGPEGKAIMVSDLPSILVDDEVILLLAKDFEVPSEQLERHFVIMPLKQKLLETRKMQGVTAELTEEGGFDGKIVFVVDKNVPYRTLSKALVSAAEAGYAGFRFAIIKREG
jgi:biopolymer transport protein ExbD